MLVRRAPRSCRECGSIVWWPTVTLDSLFDAIPEGVARALRHGGAPRGSDSTRGVIQARGSLLGAYPGQERLVSSLGLLTLSPMESCSTGSNPPVAIPFHDRTCHVLVRANVIEDRRASKVAVGPTHPHIIIAPSMPALETSPSFTTSLHPRSTARFFVVSPWTRLVEYRTLPIIIAVLHIV